jgi:hypothetical protein
VHFVPVVRSSTFSLFPYQFVLCTLHSEAGRRFQSSSTAKASRDYHSTLRAIRSHSEFPRSGKTVEFLISTMFKPNQQTDARDNLASIGTSSLPTSRSKKVAQSK